MLVVLMDANEMLSFQEATGVASLIDKVAATRGVSESSSKTTPAPFWPGRPPGYQRRTTRRSCSITTCAWPADEPATSGLRSPARRWRRPVVRRGGGRSRPPRSPWTRSGARSRARVAPSGGAYPLGHRRDPGRNGRCGRRGRDATVCFSTSTRRRANCSHATRDPSSARRAARPPALPSATSLRGGGAPREVRLERSDATGGAGPGFCVSGPRRGTAGPSEPPSCCGISPKRNASNWRPGAPRVWRRSVVLRRPWPTKCVTRSTPFRSVCSGLPRNSLRRARTTSNLGSCRLLRGEIERLDGIVARFLDLAKPPRLAPVPGDLDAASARDVLLALGRRCPPVSGSTSRPADRLAPSSIPRHSGRFS